MTSSGEPQRVKLLYLLDKIKTMEGRVRFQKMVYVLQQEKKIDFHYDFDYHFYGPYSKGLAEDIQLLVEADYIAESEKREGYCTQYNYSLTDKGRKIANQIKNEDWDRDIVNENILSTRILLLKAKALYRKAEK